MKRLAPSPGARKLALRGVRRRRVPVSEWERRDVQERVMRTGYKVDVLRDLAHETWRHVMELKVDTVAIKRRVDPARFAAHVAVSGVFASAIAATVKALWP